MVKEHPYQRQNQWYYIPDRIESEKGYHITGPMVTGYPIPDRTDAFQKGLIVRGGTTSQTEPAVRRGPTSQTGLTMRGGNHILDRTKGRVGIPRHRQNQ